MDGGTWGPWGARVARSAAAVALHNEVAASPHTRLLTSVSGPGGSGKTVLLADLASLYRAAGFETRHADDELALGDVASHSAVLVDDAHQLAEPALARLQTLVEQRDVHLVVAHRPWPQPAALRRLLSALDQHHPPVVLGPLTCEEIALYASSLLGRAVPTAVVDHVAEATGGMPRLVHRVVSAWQREGGRGLDGHDGPRAADGAVISASIVEQVGHELEHLDGELGELLLDLAVGFDLSKALPPVIERSPYRTDDLVARARSDGLLLPDGTLIPLVRQALLATTVTHHVRARQRSLVETLAGAGRSLDDVARGLARAGLEDPRVAATLEAAADNVLQTDPALAAQLYDEAVAAGGDEQTTAARRAQSAALAGDLDRAGRIVDHLLQQEEAPDLPRAVDVAAAVWAQRGMLGRSAEVYRWLGRERVGASAPLAALCMFATGDREGGEEMLAAATTQGSPTSLPAALALMGEGVRESIVGTPTRALSMLVRASDMMTATGTVTPLPYPPAGLAALVALHSGELSVAETAIDDAIKGGQGGAAARPALLLLRAWTAMLRDRPDVARATLQAAVSAGIELAPREELFLRALEVGLARRTDDTPGLVQAWTRARESILHFPVDLFSILPLGELLITAARLRDLTRTESHVAEAWGLLERLGDPPLWAVPLHWSQIQSAILTERPADLGPHAAALVRAAKQNHFALVLAAAARAWVSVLAGDFKPQTVETAARGLASVGMTWEGSRLAGHAAARSAERKDMTRLLARARDLHPGSGLPGGTPEPVVPTPAGMRPGVGTDENGLSAREREIAALVLAGKTYREIGETIYISPRTVEHHVARIRRRLGAASRSELLARLRLVLGEENWAVQ